jgi:hypothetical protein
MALASCTNLFHERNQVVLVFQEVTGVLRSLPGKQSRAVKPGGDRNAASHYLMNVTMDSAVWVSFIR